MRLAGRCLICLLAALCRLRRRRLRFSLGAEHLRGIGTASTLSTSTGEWHSRNSPFCGNSNAKDGQVYGSTPTAIGTGTDTGKEEPINTLPAAPQAVLDRIVDRRGGVRRGTWDVFCWRGTDYLFAESKRRGEDQIRSSQLEWLEAALATGLPTSSFLLVEWTLAKRGIE